MDSTTHFKLDSSLLTITSTPLQKTVMNQSSYTVFLYRVNHTLWLTVPPVLLVLGCFGNVMTIVVMRALRASDSTACLSVYFTALAVSDSILLVMFVGTQWPEMGLGIYVIQIHDSVCAAFYFLNFAVCLMSAWFLMAMTGQRMVSVILPLRVAVLCTVKRAKMVIAALVITACAFSLPVLFDYRVVTVEGNTRVCLNTNEGGAIVFTYAVLGVGSALPFLYLVVANSILIRAVVRSVKMFRAVSRKGPDQTSPRSSHVSSMTVTLILTTCVFLVLTIPICVTDIAMEMTGFYRGRIEDEELEAELVLLQTVSFLLWLSLCATNFYLYVLSGRKFREQAKRYLCPGFRDSQTVASSSS